MTKRWVNRSSNSITTVNRAGAYRRENKRNPDKEGSWCIALLRARSLIVCAHTLNVLSSWCRAKSAGPAKRVGWLAGSNGRSESAAKDCRCMPLTFAIDECSFVACCIVDAKPLLSARPLRRTAEGIRFEFLIQLF